MLFRSEGRFILVESDSAQWIPIGKNRNAIPIAGNFHFDTLNVSGGTANVVEFINFLPHTITVRNREDSDGSFFFTVEDRVPKVWNIHLYAIEGATTDTVVASDSVMRVGYLPKGRYVAEVADSNGWTHLGIINQGNELRTKRSNDTVSVGNGIDGEIIFVQWKIQPDTVMYRTFTQTQFGTKSAKVKPSKKNRYPLPNYGNVRDTILEKGVPRGTSLLIGIQRIDSARKFGWVAFKGGKGGGKAFTKALPMTSTADTFKHKKEFKNPSVKKLNNRLVGELIAIKLNILSSDLDVTSSENLTQKFGDLFYENPLDTGTIYYGKTIRELAFFTDTVLTYGSRKSNVNYSKLADILSQINGAFASPDTLSFNDTVSLFNGGLKLKGYKMVSAIPFLRRDMGIPPKTFSSVIVDQVPDEYTLEQNYPNPFNPLTVIRYSLIVNSNVTLKVYNLLGQGVATLLNHEETDEGEHEIMFDASSLSSGMYFYRLTVERNGTSLFSETKKLILLK